MTDKDQTVILPLNGDNDLPERLGAYDDFAAAEDPPADSSTGLVSLGFITAAIRRSARFWCVTAVVGLLIGFGLYLTSPHAYQASTSLLLTLGPYENINTAATNDQAMAQSRAVAGLAVHKLGLRQSAGSFLATYTVTAVTERVLVITASAPSSDQAVTPGECRGHGVPPVPGGRDAERAEAGARSRSTSRSTRPSSISARSTRRSASCRPSPRQPHSSRS